MFGFMVEKLTLFTLIINLPISLILSVFAAEITVPLFGIDFAPTADVLRILIWYALVTMAVATLSRALVVQNRQRVILVIRALGLALNIVLNLALLPRIGVRGAAIASVVSEILVVLALGSVSRAEGLRWSNLLPRLVRLGGLGGLMALALGALGSVNIVLAVAGGLTLYVVGVLLGRVLADDDWDLLYRLVAALPGGSQVRKYWRRNVELNW
jgi:O-antigen/teichoic acid export membrane protein